MSLTGQLTETAVSVHNNRWFRRVAVLDFRGQRRAVAGGSVARG